MSTLHSQIGHHILEQIKSGALKVGDRLPAEAEYATELGVSRSTLRLAFAGLEASGVLQRRKRAGTIILSDTPKQRFSMATSGLNDILSLGRDTQFTINRTGSVKTEDIPHLVGHKSETGYWLEVQGVRSLVDDPYPFSVNRVYVPARFAGIEPLLKSDNMAVFRAIESTFDVSVGRVSQAVNAIACPEKEAKIMGFAAGTPVLQIEAQLYLQNGDLMEISIATFDPERFQVRTEVDIE